MKIFAVIILALAVVSHAVERRWEYCCANIADQSSIYVDVLSTQANLEGENMMEASVWIKGDQMSTIDGRPYVMLVRMEINMDKDAKTLEYRMAEMWQVYDDGSQVSMPSKQNWKKSDLDSVVGLILLKALNNVGTIPMGGQ